MFLAYAKILLIGIQEQRIEIDNQLQTLSKNWKLERMSLVDKNILRLAAFEILFTKDTPNKVVINEAIELAKQYSSQDSFQFINGILDRLNNKEQRK